MKKPSQKKAAPKKAAPKKTPKKKTVVAAPKKAAEAPKKTATRSKKSSAVSPAISSPAPENTTSPPKEPEQSDTVTAQGAETTTTTTTTGRKKLFDKASERRKLFEDAPAENPKAVVGDNAAPEGDVDPAEARDRFRSLVRQAGDKLDQLEEIAKEGREVKADLKNIRSEAKGLGFDIRAFDETVRRDRQSKEERRAAEEFEETVSLYERWIRGNA